MGDFGLHVVAVIIIFFYIMLLFPLDRYLLEFDDDEEDGALPQRAVPFYNVVALPDGHRQ